MFCWLIVFAFLGITVVFGFASSPACFCGKQCRNKWAADCSTHRLDVACGVAVLVGRLVLTAMLRGRMSRLEKFKLKNDHACLDAGQLMRN